MTNKPKDYSYIFELLNDELGDVKQFSSDKQKQFYEESKNAAFEIMATAKIYMSAMNANKVEIGFDEILDKKKMSKIDQNINRAIFKDIKTDFVLRGHHPTEALLYNQQVPSILKANDSNDELKDEKSLYKIIKAFEKKLANGYTYYTMEIAECVAYAILNDQSLLKFENKYFDQLSDSLKRRIKDNLSRLDFAKRCDKELRPLYDKIVAAKKKKEEKEQQAKRERIEKVRQKTEERKAKENKKQEMLEKFSRFLTIYDITKNRYEQMFAIASECSDKLTSEQEKALAIITDNMNKVNNRIKKLEVSPYNYVLRGKDGTFLIDKDEFYCIDPNASTKELGKFVKAMEENTVCACFDKIIEIEDKLKEYMPKSEQVLTRK